MNDCKVIKETITQCERKQVSESQIKEALKHIHKGKSENCKLWTVSREFILC